MSEYNPFSLKDKTIFVTGASSGIGRAIAIECSKMGANIVLSGRNEDRLKETLSLMESKNHQIIVADLNGSDTLEEMVKEFPSIQGVVHCAGLTISKPFQFISENNMSEVMNVNYYAPVYLTQQLLKFKKIKKGSSIVFISSVSGVYVTAMGNSMYCGSKGAINGIAKGIALELATKGIRVNTVVPGMVDTNILSAGVLSEDQIREDIKKYPLKRYGKPEEVAHAVIYLLSEASSWVTGSNLLIDGGYTLL